MFIVLYKDSKKNDTVYPFLREIFGNKKFIYLVLFLLARLKNIKTPATDAIAPTAIPATSVPNPL